MRPGRRGATGVAGRRTGWTASLGGGALAALAGLLSACAAQPPARIAVGPDPLDPNVPVPAISPASSLGPYTSQRPVEPAPWGQVNQDVQPQPETQ